MAREREKANVLPSISWVDSQGESLAYLTRTVATPQEPGVPESEVQIPRQRERGSRGESQARARTR